MRRRIPSGSLVEGVAPIHGVRDHGNRGILPSDGGSCVTSRSHRFVIKEMTRPLASGVGATTSFDAAGFTGPGSRLHLFSLALGREPGITFVTPTDPNPGSETLTSYMVQLGT